MGHGLDSGGGDGEETLGAPAALGGGIAQAGCHESLLLQAIERGVERSGSGFAIRAGGNFRADCDAVGVVVQTQDGQQDNLLKFAESTFRIHMDYNVVFIRNIVKW